MPTTPLSFDELKNGVVLAELGGYGDGPYCARFGAGAALVLLGTYIVDPGDAVAYPTHFVFKPHRSAYYPYLLEHIASARASRARVGVSIISIEMPHSIDFLAAAQDAGADYVSLCLHSTMEMFLESGTSSVLCRRENWGRLREWARESVAALDVPMIFKIGLYDDPRQGERDDIFGAVDLIVDAGVPLVHINVGSCESDSAGLEAVRRLAGRAPCLIAGGGVRDLAGAQRLLAAGADAVAIGTAAMRDQYLCARLQAALRPGGSA